MSKEWFAIMSRKNTLVVLGQGQVRDFPRQVRESLKKFLNHQWTDFWVVWRDAGKYRLVRYRAKKADRKTTVICSAIARGETYVWRGAAAQKAGEMKALSGGATLKRLLGC